MSKHTPGPWTNKRGASIVAGDKVIATVHEHYHKGVTEVEAQANARLIAAAPKLLEVCKMIDWNDSEWEGPEGTLFKWTQLARTAVREVEGES